MRLALGNRAEWAAAAGFLILVAVYGGISMAYLPQEVFWSPDSGMKYLQTANIRWEEGPSFSIRYPGRAIDPHLEYVPLGFTYYTQDGGELYGIWSPVFPLLSKPFLELAGYQGLLILPIIFGALTSLASYWLLNGHPVRLKVLAALITGLSTPVLVYSLLYWEHTLYAFLVLLATVVLITHIEKVEPDYKLLFLAGFLFGLAMYFRPEGLIFAVAAAVAWVLTFNERRQIKGMTLAATGFASSLALYYLIDHFVPIGTRSHVQKNFTVPDATNLEYANSQGLEVISDFLVGTNVSGGLGLFFVVSLASALAVLALRQNGFIPRAAFLLALAGLVAASVLILMASQEFTVLNGLLSVSPVLAFGVFMLYAPRRYKRPTFLTLTALFYFSLSAMILTFLSPNSATRTVGGLEWGPRFFLPFYPLMAVVAVYYLGQLLKDPSTLFKAAGLTLFSALLIVGVGIQLTGVQRILEHKQSSESMRQVLAHIHSDAVLTTDLWWLSTGPMAFDFTERKLLQADNPDQLHSLVARLHEQGVSRFWLVSYVPPEHHQGLVESGEDGFQLLWGERWYAKDGLCFCQILLHESTPDQQLGGPERRESYTTPFEPGP